jgi:DNA replication protein DnaC
MMDEVIESQLKFLGLRNLPEQWDSILSEARKKKPSYHRFLAEIIGKEYAATKERKRLARLRQADIPETLVMETFPFTKQPNLKKRLVMELFDSMDYIQKKQELIFIGPTGCGKTGLATSFLIHALNQGYRGCFIDFKDLVDRLYQSVADHTEKKVIRRFQSYDCLMIDELGYVPVEREQAGLFFDLMKRRHKKKTTLITTQLGFEEWDGFLQNQHLTAALLDRITENCVVFNMKKCISIRPKNITYATSDRSSFKKSHS